MKLKKHVLAALTVALSGLVATAASAQVVPVGGPLLQDLVPGSMLVFTKFDIRGTTTTQLRIVNNDGFPGEVHLNYVCPGVKFGDDRCRALDRTVDFTPHQTRIIDVADHNPPCNQGYVVAYAQDTLTHTPRSYNWLTGSSIINSGRRVESQNAIAIQSPQALGTVLGSGTPRSFAIGGADFSGLPTYSFTDFRATAFGSEPTADEGSNLTLLTLDVLAGAQNPPALVNIDYWSASEEPFSTSYEFICWTEVALEEIDNNFLQDNLGTTHGSMSIFPVGNCPVAGTCPPLPLYDATVLGSISEYGDGDVGGRLLTHDATPKATVYRPR